LEPLLTAAEFGALFSGDESMAAWTTAVWTTDVTIGVTRQRVSRNFASEVF
jgi:hypothetical protein